MYFLGHSKLNTSLPEERIKIIMKRNNFNNLAYLLVITALYIYNTEAAECYAYTGPNGARKCEKVSGYNGYQWMTCRTDSYLKSKSNGRHQCSIFSIGQYCLYQCMLEVYGNTRGDVKGICRCHPGKNTCIKFSDRPATTGRNHSWVGRAPHTLPTPSLHQFMLDRPLNSCYLLSTSYII